MIMTTSDYRNMACDVYMCYTGLLWTAKFGRRADAGLSGGGGGGGGVLGGPTNAGNCELCGMEE